MINHCHTVRQNGQMPSLSRTFEWMYPAPKSDFRAWPELYLAANKWETLALLLCDQGKAAPAAAAAAAWLIRKNIKNNGVQA